jgi:hypothetical protein
MAKPFMARSMRAEKIKEHCDDADSLNLRSSGPLNHDTEKKASSAESVGTKLAQIAEGMYVSMSLGGQFLSFNLESRSMP